MDLEALECITRRQGAEGEGVGRVECRGVCVCVAGVAQEPSQVSGRRCSRELSF